MAYKVLVFITLCSLVVFVADARPTSRQKRVSDQRLAELETLLALARLRGKMVTVPVGFGVVDPARIGKRKRSVDNLYNQLDTAPQLFDDINDLRSYLEENYDDEEDDQTEQHSPLVNRVLHVLGYKSPSQED